jgi:hypothetical protein
VVGVTPFVLPIGIAMVSWLVVTAQ